MQKQSTSNLGSKSANSLATPSSDSVPPNGQLPTQAAPPANNPSEGQIYQPVAVYSIAALRLIIDDPTATHVVDDDTDRCERQKYLDEYTEFVHTWQGGPINNELATKLWRSNYVSNNKMTAVEWRMLYQVEDEQIQAEAISYRFLAELLKHGKLPQRVKDIIAATWTEVNRHIHACLYSCPEYDTNMDDAFEYFIWANTLKIKLLYSFEYPLRSYFLDRCPLVPEYYIEVTCAVWEVHQMEDTVEILDRLQLSQPPISKDAKG